MRMITDRGCRRLLARCGGRAAASALVLVAFVVGQLARPAWAGAYDPGRLARVAHGLVAGPVSGVHVAVGVRLRVPLQGGGHDRWRRSSFGFGLDLRRTAMFAGPAAAFAPARVRPLARFSFSPAAPARLRLNGVNLAAWRATTAVTLGDDTDDKDDKTRKHRRRKIVKWVLIGAGGFLLTGIIVTAVALATTDSIGGFGPPVGPEPGM